MTDNEFTKRLKGIEDELNDFYDYDVKVTMDQAINLIVNNKCVAYFDNALNAVMEINRGVYDDYKIASIVYNFNEKVTYLINQYDNELYGDQEND